MKKRNKSKWSKARKAQGLLATALAITPFVGNTEALANWITFNYYNLPVNFIVDQGAPLDIPLYGYTCGNYFQISCGFDSYSVRSNTVSKVVYSMTATTATYSLSITAPNDPLTSDLLSSYTVGFTKYGVETSGTFNVRVATPPKPKTKDVSYSVRPNESLYLNLADLFEDRDNNLVSTEASFTFNGTTHSGDYSSHSYGTDLFYSLHFGSETGTRTITIDVKDADYPSLPTHHASKTITVQVQNQSPVAGPNFNMYDGKQFRVPEGGPNYSIPSIPLKGLFTDPDNDTLSYSLLYKFDCSAYYETIKADSVVFDPNYISFRPYSIVIRAYDIYGAYRDLNLSVLFVPQVSFDYPIPNYLDSHAFAKYQNEIRVTSTSPQLVYLAPADLKEHTIAELDKYVADNKASAIYTIASDAKYANYGTFSALGLPEGKYRLYMEFDHNDIRDISASNQTIIILDGLAVTNALKAGDTNQIDISKIVSYSNKSGAADAPLRQDRDYVQALLEFIPPKIVKPTIVK
jgi:hypothetical protein